MCKDWKKQEKIKNKPKKKVKVHQHEIWYEDPQCQVRMDLKLRIPQTDKLKNKQKKNSIQNQFQKRQKLVMDSGRGSEAHSEINHRIWDQKWVMSHECFQLPHPLWGPCVFSRYLLVAYVFLSSLQDPCYINKAAYCFCVLRRTRRMSMNFGFQKVTVTILGMRSRIPRTV